MDAGGGVSGPFIRRPVATTLLMAAMLLVGLVAYPLLPVAPLPQIDFPTIAVSAALPGASPETMASSVAQPLERQIAQIPGVSQMTSTSVARRDRDHRAVRSRPQHRRRRQRRPGRDQRRLRAAAEEPAEPADLSQGQPVGHADPDPVGAVRRRADHQRRRLRRKHPRPAHQPDLRRLAGARRRPADSRRSASRSTRPSSSRRTCSSRTSAPQIAQATVDNPKGSITGDKQSFTIYDNDQLTDAKPWHDVIVAYRNGAPVRVRDIGEAVDGPTDAMQRAWSNGKPSVFLVIFKQPGANVIKTVAEHQADPGQARARRSRPTFMCPCSPTAPPPSAPRSRTCSSR